MSETNFVDPGEGCDLGFSEDYPRKELEISYEGLDDAIELAGESDRVIAQIENGPRQYQFSPENRSDLLRMKTQRQVIERVLSAVFPQEDPNFWDSVINSKLSNSS